MSDDFASYIPSIDAPSSRAAAITPDDDTDLPNATRALYVGGAGNVAVTMVGGDTVTLTGVLAGAMYPLRISRVLATGTTATGLVGLR